MVYVSLKFDVRNLRKASMEFLCFWRGKKK
jgi:hypothetical protein